MQVLVTVIDDNNNSQTFQLEKVERPKENRKKRNKFHVENGSSPIIATAWVLKDFKAVKNN